MLEHLPDEHDIAGWQVIAHGVKHTKVDLRVLPPILLDDKIDHVAGNIPSGPAHELAAYVEIPATDVDDRGHADIA